MPIYEIRAKTTRGEKKWQLVVETYINSVQQNVPFAVNIDGKNLFIVKADGKKYYTWEVHPATFKETGDLIAEPPPSLDESPERYRTYRAKRLESYLDAMRDAYAIALEVKNGNFLPLLDHDDIRAIAISMAIDFQKAK